ncbi:MAG: penicillin acylase family protein [Desulfosalsimonadaceae bacterium]
MRNKHWLIVALVLVFGFTFSANAAVTTSRDDKGVWFVKGADSDSTFDVFEAVGYAVATDRLWQAETFRRAANGNLAEIFGPDYLEQDTLVRMTGYSDAELTAGYTALDTETRRMIDGYVAGFNRRIAEVTANPALLPFEFHALARQLGLQILVPAPWTPEDVMAWEALMLRQFDPEAQRQGQLNNAALLQYLMTLFGQAQGMGMFNDLRWTNDPAATTYIPKSQALTGVSGAQVPAEPSVISPGPMPAMDLQVVAGQMENRWVDRRKKLEQINAYAAMGSYAWVISGDKSASGRPILYSGPQMGFDTPAIVSEGSIDAAGLKISGMAIAGLPGIIIGRTPHHAWSMQVGHAHTVDYYFEPAPGAVPSGYYTSRQETIPVAGGVPVTLTVYRTPHGPVVNPMNFNPATYDATVDGPIVAWRYSHWEKEFGTVTAFLGLARAKSMDEFGAALRDVGVSQHFCYADNNGNIAYWMSGMDPVRPASDGNGQPVDWRFPQGMFGTQTEWGADLKPLSTDRNTAQGFYAGWNSKTSPDYENSSNNPSYYFGPFHRAHVLDDYLSVTDDLTFEQVRDLAANIAATDSFGNGGNPWAFVEDDFRAAVAASPSDARTGALGIMNGFDGHFPAGGQVDWTTAKDRSDAWMLADAWIRAALDLTFLDELGSSGDEYDSDTMKWKNPTVLFNVMLHALAGENASVQNNYNWFSNPFNPEAPQTADAVIVAALDMALAELGARPWGIGQRGKIEFNHAMFNNPPLALNPLHTMPFASRSTYAHCIEMGKSGPIRIESMFPLGQSGNILAGLQGEPVFDANFYTMAPVFDFFAYRDFPVFAKNDDECDDDSCFIKTLLMK